MKPADVPSHEQVVPLRLNVLPSHYHDSIVTIEFESR